MTENLCTWKTRKDIEKKMIHLANLIKKPIRIVYIWYSKPPLYKANESFIHFQFMYKMYIHYICTCLNRSLTNSHSWAQICSHTENNMKTKWKSYTHTKRDKLHLRGWTDVLIKKIFPIYQKKVTSHAKRCKYKDSRRKLFHGSSKHTKYVDTYVKCILYTRKSSSSKKKAF